MAMAQQIFLLLHLIFSLQSIYSIILNSITADVHIFDILNIQQHTNVYTYL